MTHDPRQKRTLCSTSRCGRRPAISDSEAPRTSPEWAECSIPRLCAANALFCRSWCGRWLDDLTESRALRSLRTCELAQANLPWWHCVVPSRTPARLGQIHVPGTSVEGDLATYFAHPSDRLPPPPSEVTTLAFLSQAEERRLDETWPVCPSPARAPHRTRSAREGDVPGERGRRQDPHPLSAARKLAGESWRRLPGAAAVPGDNGHRARLGPGR